MRQLARADARTRLLMSAPGVGAIVALTYVAAIDDPGRFSSSKVAGAHFGLTPKRYQSGEKDVTGRISKIGDGGVRTALYEAANVILTRPVKGSALKSWAMRLANRDAQGEGGVGAQARRDPPSHAGRRHHLRARQGRYLRRLNRRRPPRVRAALDTCRPEQVPSPGRRTRPGRKMLGGAARRPRATRLADLLPIRPHQVAATAPTPDRSETPAAGPQLKRD